MKNLYISLLLCLLLSACTPDSQVNPAAAVEQNTSPEQEIFYHVFQRSFYDSNEDGQGDLNGITAKLDYLEDLGVTSILMTPLYESIYYHNYFPDDFMAIDPEYGSLQDYENMIAAIHNRDMKFYMDMEIHYVTINHPWYKGSFENPQSEFSDYIIYNGPGNTDPESMIFNLHELESYNGDVLKITTIDLENEHVRNYVFDLFKYWVDPNKDGEFTDGVDGFRIDHMMDDLDWKGIRTNLLANFWGPLVRELKAINPGLNIIAEQANWNDLGTDYFDKSDVDMMFAFTVREAIAKFDKSQIIDKIDTTLMATPDHKSQLIFLENHDIVRFASVVDGNPAKLRLGAALTLLLKGVPLIYYGQELGMRGEGGFGKFGTTDGNDIPMREAFEWYKTVDGNGMALWYKNTGPWWDQTGLKDNDGISVEEQLGDRNSLLNFYRKMTMIRKSNTAFTQGKQSFLANNSNRILSFCRWDENGAFLAAFNMGEEKTGAVMSAQDWPLEDSISDLRLVIGDGVSTARIQSDGVEFSMPAHGYAVWRVRSE